MVLQKGDFILVELTGKVKETSEVFDTTDAETARKERLQKEGEIYEPRLIVVGEGWVLKPLDDAFADMEIGKLATVEISPEKAFGERDPAKVKQVHIKKLAEKGINPVLGARIEYGGKNAIIRSIGAGRVLLDFNPPLAGKTLVYNVTVAKKVETPEEKIAALIHRRIPVTEEGKFKFGIAGKTLTIDMPEETMYLEGIQIAKRGIALDIQRYLPDLEETKLVETFKAPPKPETAKPVDEKPAAHEEKIAIIEEKHAEPAPSPVEPVSQQVKSEEPKV